MSWAAHDLEPYAFQKHMRLSVAFVPLLIGSYAPDMMTKWFVYGIHIGPWDLKAHDPAQFHRGWPGFGFTHSFVYGAVVCLIKFNQASDDAGNPKPGQLGTDAETKLRAAYDEADSWRTRGFVMAGVVLVGAVVSGYLWGETAPKRPALNIHPTPDGAAVSLSGRF